MTLTVPEEEPMEPDEAAGWDDAPEDDWVADMEPDCS